MAVIRSANPPEQLATDFVQTFNESPAFFVRAPGRVDLIGTHTDYNEGWVLTCAIDRSIWYAVRPLPTPILSMRSVDMNDQVAIRLTELDVKTTMTHEPLPQWAAYPAGVAWALQEAGYATPGLEVAIMGDLPIGQGMSSSAALEVGMVLAMSHVTNWDIDKMQLALYCQKAENDYVGLSCGLMDQFSSLFGEENHALLLDCRTHEWEAVPMGEQVALVLADTSTRRDLVNSAYNERREECERAARMLAQRIPEVKTLRDVSVEQLMEYSGSLPSTLQRRAEHIISENNRVLAAAEMLRGRSVRELGAIMDESMISSRDLFDASSTELDEMWHAGRGVVGGLGGRFVGAGWAGNVLFLVQKDHVESFIEETGARYRDATGLTGHFNVLYPSKGAEIVL